MGQASHMHPWLFYHSGSLMRTGWNGNLLTSCVCRALPPLTVWLCYAIYILTVLGKFATLALVNKQILPKLLLLGRGYSPGACEMGWVILISFTV